VSEQATTVGETSRPSIEAKTRSRFFVRISGILILIVVIGFSPTLYFRAYFDAPEVPVYMLIHGVLLTAWFVWFFIQTSLVAARRTDLHRRFGIAGIVIGAAVVVASAIATFGIIPRTIALGFDPEADIALYAGAIWANLGTLITFFILLSFAIWNRHRPEFHKRLMLLSSIAIVGPACARIARYPWFQVSESQVVNEGVYALGGTLLLLLALVVYDRVVSKRVHPVTMWAAPIVFATPLVYGFLVANTEFGRSLVKLLI
jgi:hypothetical protein